MSRMAALRWPEERLADALAVVAGKGADSGAAAGTSSPVEAAAALGLDAEALAAVPSAEELGSRTVILAAVAPDRGSGWLLLRGAHGRRFNLVGADGSRVRLDRTELEEMTGGAAENPFESRWREALEAIGTTRGTGRRRRIPSFQRPAELGLRVRAYRLLPAGGMALAEQARRTGVVAAAGVLAVTHAAQYLLWIASWWLIGRGALEGRLDSGWLAAWALLLATRVPLVAAASRAAGVTVVRASTVLRRRLLAGILALEPVEVASFGCGRLLGRLLESGSFEVLALNGGVLTLTASVELVFAAAVLVAGVGGWPHAVLLLVWVAVLVVVATRTSSRIDEWTRARLELTDGLVERMVGHLTRLLQQPAEQWHEGEDAAAELCQRTGRRMDRVGPVMLAALRRGWMLAGIAGLAPALLSRDPAPGPLAVGLGGVLLASASVSNLATGLVRLAAARVSWRQSASLRSAARRVDPVATLPVPLEMDTGAPASERAHLEAREVELCRPDRTRPVLHHLNLRVAAGERCRIVGVGGSGRSSLAAVLLGMLRSDRGELVIAGLDLASLGSERWRRWVVGQPASEQDHLLGSSLAFNLLIGRGWPPSAADLADAEAVCRELGLGHLLDAMPSGLFTQVGDTGWQLSHGERTRVFLARGLLRGGRFLVLDGPLSGLDPITGAAVIERLDRDQRAVVLL
jgi:ATP-binding cassette, subfamily B, bacterial